MSHAYSAELSQKVKRGISISKEQCKFIGGFIPLGYSVDDNKRYQIDPLTAPVVKRYMILHPN
jgi:DNA invertase Pin-like site-specific DNA recombinase